MKLLSMSFQAYSQPSVKSVLGFGVCMYQFSSVLFHILYHKSDNNKCLQVDWDKI